jgi:hypothetical protein
MTPFVQSLLELEEGDVMTLGSNRHTPTCPIFASGPPKAAPQIRTHTNRSHLIH